MLLITAVCDVHTLLLLLLRSVLDSCFGTGFSPQRLNSGPEPSNVTVVKV